MDRPTLSIIQARTYARPPGMHYYYYSPVTRLLRLLTEFRLGADTLLAITLLLSLSWLWSIQVVHRMSGLAVR